MNSLRRIQITGLITTVSLGLVGAAYGQANQPQPTSPNGTQAAGGANQPNGVSTPANPKPAANGADGAANNANPSNSGPNQGANNRSSANPYAYNGINQVPWFSNPAVRRELNLDDTRYKQFNQGYGQAWGAYNQGMNSLGQNNSGRWSQQQQELTNEFHRHLDNHVNNAFPDQAPRDRYNQLYTQYRGYAAFNDPQIQKQLNLTPAQIQRFNQYNRDWNTKMQRWNIEYPNNPAAVRNAFDSYESNFQGNLGSTLTPEQQSKWESMTGSRFNFTPDYYFQNGPVVGAVPNGTATAPANPISEE